MRLTIAFSILVAHMSFVDSVSSQDDSYLWLEEVENKEALAWAEELSQQTTSALESVPEFEGIHNRLLEIFNSDDKIPSPSMHGDWIYNFWQDSEHVRGIWRRTSLSEYAETEPDWETVLDLDVLAEAESENWVWSGAVFLEPENDRCMLSLSRGGADATVMREFDTTTKSFVSGGFSLPEAKQSVTWLDEDSLWIGSDFGEGSLTESGYPRVLKLWKRGTPLDQAEQVFAGELEDVRVFGSSSYISGVRYNVVRRGLDFFNQERFLSLDGRLVKLEMPTDAQLRGFYKDHILLSLRSDWMTGGTTYEQGSLLTIELDDFLQGSRDFHVLFKPEDRVSLSGVDSTKNYLLYTTLDNVRGRLYRARKDGGEWTHEEVELPGLGSVGINDTSDTDDRFFFSYTDFTSPTSLYLVEADGVPQMLKSTPEQFDATGMSVEQYEATSKDGTKIPYFVFMPKDFVADGTNPTMLTAYGGFGVSRRPTYSGTTGAAWVERGGVYVLANIRGGGEFGPQWHQAAMRENHQNNFDDFTAVGKDLIARGITSPEHLGCMGGSQGGLLVGGSFVQAPELFNAVVCAVPLLDMKRFNKLLAGASWMAEYGNPDTDDWEFIKLWSPYQNLDSQQEYPRVFFWTNTRDDRVHPGHARKMVAKMLDMDKPVYYYENTEGGHGGGANLNQAAYTSALTYAYLWMRLR